MALVSKPKNALYFSIFAFVMVKGQGDRDVGVGDIGRGSSPAAQPDSRTDEDSRLSHCSNLASSRPASRTSAMRSPLLC